MNQHEITLESLSYEKIREYSKSKVAICRNCPICQRQFCFSYPETFCGELVNQFRFSLNANRPTVTEGVKGNQQQKQ